MKEKFSAILNVNRGRGFKVNYENLKNYLEYEDFFYENVVQPMCRKAGYEISFDKEFLVLKPKEEKGER